MHHLRENSLATVSFAQEYHYDIGDHQRMGLVEVAHKMLDRLAVTMFHEQGAGMPEECFAYAYQHATKVKDIHAQRFRKNKSSFELRTGKTPNNILI